MSNLTDEQQLALVKEGHDLISAAYLASANRDDKEHQLNCIALAARRIAEIVLPKDLRYTP